MDNGLNHAYDQSSELIIAGTKIRKDDKDYYSFYNFHRASERSDSKKPSKWLRNEQTKDLIDELRSVGIRDRHINVIKTGTNDDRGVCAVEELIDTYVIWISPSYNLQIIRAHDDLIQDKYLTTVDFNHSSILLNILMTYTENCILLENESKELKPKVDGYDRISLSDELMCITDVFIDLQINPENLFDYLKEKKCICRSAENKNLIEYQDKIQNCREKHVYQASMSDFSSEAVLLVLLKAVQIISKTDLQGGISLWNNNRLIFIARDSKTNTFSQK